MKKINRSICLLTFVMLFCAFTDQSVAQDTITSQEFFGLTPGIQVLGPMGPDDVKFPVIEEYEFRTETDEFDFGRQEYLFRVSPSTKQKRKAQAELYQHLAGKPDYDLMETSCASILEMHLDWLDLYYGHQQLEVIAQLEAVYADKKVVLEKKMQSLSYNPKTIIDYETDQNDLALDKFEQLNNLETLYQKYQWADPVFSFADFVKVEQLPIQGGAIAAELTTDQREDVYDLAQLDKEYALEQAEKNQYFDFAQVRYRGPHDDLFRERVSLTAAFRLRTSGNRQLNMQELLLEKQQLTAKMELDQSQLQTALTSIRLELVNELAYYRYYTGLMDQEAVYMTQLTEQLVRQPDVDPMDLLEIQERKQKNDWEKNRLERNVYERYLKLLFTSRKLCRQNAQNWLRL